MPSMIDHVVSRVLALQVGMLACRERLAADTDSEALHDLRTTLRRLRSLLRPLRGLPGVEQLEEAAGALGTLTTPLRDREVLAAQLVGRGHVQAGERRQEGRARTFAGVASSAQLTRVLAILDAFPLFLRAADREGLTQGMRRRIDKRLEKQWRKLARALDDPAHDRHRLRLLIKRVRYGDEAYPQLEHAGKRLQRLLKKAQGDLGDWHDRVQWLLQVHEHSDLAGCKVAWEHELHAAEGRSDLTLEALQKALARR
ncbi:MULTISPECIES: CHAD domain-containing protein [unclassified Pseudomonas]|uniref:CHAD domain-containing protein n=1 Tax=unclassified Pseudomonas TaxID=196821 RepID=UPI000C88ABA5|nr:MULTISPECIES: CHAD domain-containing protein [unclassified Pseudomonas]PMZ97346.1 metal-chelation protein CHAD [Pseudomonas sp. FW305-42]PNA22209.1 metal-chelation protein CHAD [Pseudomonas sp. MPR-R1B]PNB26665.1 metal-chelation protein CHAD [Pseudomonas sp. DP16D-E2]PNB43955.1 metal-chelation protein CHAD [Pseudomonas sp. FW305-17]PNB59685.1 metal-chelation protein CHAD [Pseudomonas sp. GW531-E2]